LRFINDKQILAQETTYILTRGITYLYLLPFYIAQTKVFENDRFGKTPHRFLEYLSIESLSEILPAEISKEGDRI